MLYISVETIILQYSGHLIKIDYMQTKLSYTFVLSILMFYTFMNSAMGKTYYWTGYAGGIYTKNLNSVFSNVLTPWFPESGYLPNSLDNRCGTPTANDDAIFGSSVARELSNLYGTLNAQSITINQSGYSFAEAGITCSTFSNYDIVTLYRSTITTNDTLINNGTLYIYDSNLVISGAIINTGIMSFSQWNNIQATGLSVEGGYKKNETETNGFAGTTATYATVIECRDTGAITRDIAVWVRYADNSYALNTDGTITLTKETTDFSTYYLNKDSISLSNIQHEADGNEVKNIIANGGSLILDAKADTLSVTLAENAHLEISGDALVKEIITNQTELALDSNSSLSITNGLTSFTSLTLNDGSVFTLGTEESHANDLMLTEISVCGHASINADLVLNGTTLIFSDDSVITMGCDVTIEGSDITIVLNAQEIATLQSGGSVDLFLNVDCVTLGDGDNITFTNTDRTETYARFALESVDDSKGKHTIRAINITPEPTAAALNILALSTIILRRRRK